MGYDKLILIPKAKLIFNSKLIFNFNYGKRYNLNLNNFPPNSIDRIINNWKIQNVKDKPRNSEAFIR